MSSMTYKDKKAQSWPTRNKNGDSVLHK